MRRRGPGRGRCFRRFRRFRPFRRFYCDRRYGCDDGSGTVLVLALVAVLCTGVALLGLLGGAAVARHRAQTAADLAALAAADVLLGRRAGSPCPVADQVAATNGARLRTCDDQGDGSVVVVVTVTPAGALARLGHAQATARAGAQPVGVGP